MIEVITLSKIHFANENNYNDEKQEKVQYQEHHNVYSLVNFVTHETVSTSRRRTSPARGLRDGAASESAMTSQKVLLCT
jgi:hypothetical protein